MTHHIFISYAHKNGEIAASLASQLDDLGLKVFLAERNLNAGEDWEPTVRVALKNSKIVLCLITPESKTSGWVHAEAGAAWVLEKPILPVFRLVEPSEMTEILRMPHGRKIETSEQIDALLDDICKMFSLPRLGGVRVSLAAEDFNAPESWTNLLKIGPWLRNEDDRTISGRGMHNYVLSRNHYLSNFTIESVLRFVDLSSVNRLDPVNAGIVLGWTTPRGIRRYYNLLMNQERLLLELIGDRGDDAYMDYRHLDDDIPFTLTKGVTYAITVTVADQRVVARIISPSGQLSYSAALPENPLGRVGLRPWRSRIECERFVVRST